LYGFLVVHMQENRRIKTEKGRVRNVMANYESELSERFIEELALMYGIDKTVVYPYFHLRFLIEYSDRAIEFSQQRVHMVGFLVKELNLPVESFLYKGESIARMFQMENCLYSLVVDWWVTGRLKSITNSKGVVMSYDDYIEQEKNKLLRYGKNKAKPHKSSNHYMSYMKWNALELLNKQYVASPTTPRELECVEYPAYHNFFVRSLEGIHFANIHSVEMVSTTVASITENDLEKYLMKNLDRIEEGLRYMDRQVSIKDGRIDILARDKNGETVIIELKVQEDKELIWQAIYYPLQFKRERHETHVRMMTVSPHYPTHILSVLKELKDVEIIEFKPLVEFGRIKHLEMKKIS
jgi:Holliday junction resolvase-like predicted endonuclease